MKKIPLRERLLRYLQNHQGQFIAKGALCDLARDKVGATGEHTGRRLRELHEEGLIQVEHRNNHSWYCYATN